MIIPPLTLNALEQQRFHECIAQIDAHIQCYRLPSFEWTFEPSDSQTLVEAVQIAYYTHKGWTVPKPYRDNHLGKSGNGDRWVLFFHR